jgi:hypothetical protein
MYEKYIQYTYGPFRERVIVQGSVLLIKVKIPLATSTNSPDIFALQKMYEKAGNTIRKDEKTQNSSRNAISLVHQFHGYPYNRRNESS